MNSIFGRALVGFIALTIAICIMAGIALWAIETFAGGVWWASLAVVAVALITECGVYSSTLHSVVLDWVKEPQERRRMVEAQEKISIDVRGSKL